MALFLSHADIEAVVDMAEAMGAVERALVELDAGRAVNAPRQRFRVPRGVFRQMGGALPSAGVMGTKAGIQSFAFPDGVSKESTQVLYSTESGELLALFWSDRITDVRTGAAGGISARHLARADAHVIAVLGAGVQARTQLEAVALARPPSEARVFSPTEANRRSFATEMSTVVGTAVEPVATAREAVEGADIVICATSATEPILDGAWLAPGAHVISIRSSYRVDIATGQERREIDDTTVARSAVIAVDSLEQAALQESPELGAAIEGGRAVELGTVIAGGAAGRADESQVTLFKCFGMGLYDVAVAERIYRRAVDRGLGLELPSP